MLEFITASFVWEDVDFGSVMIFATKDIQTVKTMIETIVQQASISLRRLKAENELGESESKYRNLFESMEEGVFYQRADGQLVDVNDAALRMFGLTRDEFLGRTSRHPDWKVINEDGTLLQPEQHPSMVVLATGKPVKDRVVGVYNPLTECLHLAGGKWNPPIQCRAKKSRTRSFSPCMILPN